MIPGPFSISAGSRTGVSSALLETSPMSNRPWFRPKRDGLGWTPVTWEGWLVTLASVAAVILINVLLLILGTLVDMAPSILIATPILLPVMQNFGVDPVHFGMIMLLNLGIGLCHPPVGSILFVGCAVGKVSIEEVMKKIWPFYAVMFLVLMFVTYLPEVSLWLPRHVLR